MTSGVFTPFVIPRTYLFCHSEDVRTRNLVCWQNPRSLTFIQDDKRGAQDDKRGAQDDKSSVLGMNSWKAKGNIPFGLFFIPRPFFFCHFEAVRTRNLGLITLSDFGNMRLFSANLLQAVSPAPIRSSSWQALLPVFFLPGHQVARL